MREPYAHPMMPKATHDERARQDYVASFKILMEEEVYPGSKKVYETQVLPQFLREHNRPPKDRHEVRRAMEREGYTQTWSSIARTLQEMLWDNVGESIERQLPELIDRARVDNPWDTYHNAEPFWGALHDITVEDLMATAGFPRDAVRDAWATIDDQRGTVIVPADDETSTLYRSSIFGARKAV